jgi:SnoaL-like domain
MVSSASDEEETMSESVRELVREYVSAAGDKRFDRLAELVHPDATLTGTVKARAEGAEAFVQGFRNLGPIIERNDMRDLVVEGDRAFVLYDFVTDTPVGSVLCGELLTIEDGLIRSSTLIFDWRRWTEVLQELQTRMAQQPERSDA